MKKNPMDKRMQKLCNALLYSIENEVFGVKKAAVLFSGGLDSSLIAALVSKKIQVILYCVGLKESYALKSSVNAAELLNLKLKRIIVSEKEIPRYLSAVKKLLKTENFLQLSIALPEFIALQKIKKDKIKHVFCGHGADEMFFGYDEFRRLLSQKKSFDELEKLREKKLKNLFKDNLKRDFAIANHFKLKLHAPYLNENFKKIALTFSAEENVFSENDFLRKHVLRELALQFIPRELAFARKKAIQYDSGFSKALKKLF